MFFKYRNQKIGEPKGKSKIFNRFIWCIIIILLVFLTLNIFILNADINSFSMSNTLKDGDRVLGLKSAYWYGDVSRGDIIILNSPESNDPLVKRVIALPGEEVKIEDGNVFINGKKLSEDYVSDKNMIYDNMKPFKVPKDNYFVLGDNRMSSNDSRSWSIKTIRKSDILAKVVLIYYPFDRIKII